MPYLCILLVTYVDVVGSDEVKGGKRDRVFIDRVPSSLLHDWQWLGEEMGISIEHYATVNVCIEFAQPPHSVTKNLEHGNMLLDLEGCVLAVTTPQVDREELQAVNLVHEVEKPDMYTTT